VFFSGRRFQITGCTGSIRRFSDGQANFAFVFLRRGFPMQWRSRCARLLLSCTKTPRRLKRGGQRCRSGSGDGLFTRCRMSDAGSLNHGNGKCPTDLKRDAVAVASFRFVRGIVAARSGAAAMASRPGASGGGISSWLRQAKVKSITRAAMPVLIAARRWKTTKHIAGISFRHCRPRVI
jgi:hypothetical protein